MKLCRTRSRGLLHCGLAALLAAFLLFSAASARADGTAVQTLPGNGCTANTLPADDDSSTTSPVALGFTLNYGATPYTDLYVNNNGNVTFNQDLSTYTPYDFTTTGDTIIAPFLADVDTRGVGTQQTTYGSGTLSDGTTKYFCVDWVNVGYYEEHTDKTDSFQLVLTQTPQQAAAAHQFTITFNYDRIDWETGDLSGGTNGFGGTSAAVGYASGDGNQQDVFAGSFDPGSLLDSNPTTGLINGSLNAGGQLGRYVFNIGSETPNGTGAVTGTVNAPADIGGVESGAPVVLCPTGGGACVTRATNDLGTYRATGLAPGTYTVTAYPNSDDAYAAATSPAETVTANATTANVNLTLGDAPALPPSGTTFTGDGTSLASNGSPVIDWEDGGTVTTEACSGAALSYTMTVAGRTVAGGPLTQVSVDNNTGSGIYQGSYPATQPVYGEATVTITGTCPAGGSAVDDVFGVYIDPSGTVVNQNGTPVAGAAVTLTRSSSAAGPFVPVPDGSAEMSPANRRNPSTSGSDGSFGWDVVAGFYQIRATAPGCTSTQDHTNPRASSAVLQVPPPQIGLQVVMYCAAAAPASPPPTAPTAPAAPTAPTAPVATAATVSASAAAALTSQFQSLIAELKKGLASSPFTPFSITGTFPQPGLLTITVSTPSSAKAKQAVRAAAVDAARKGKGKGKKKRKSTLIKVASARATITTPGVAKVKVTATAAGKKLLAAAAKHHRRLKLSLVESFAPQFAGQTLSPITPTGTFAVSPKVKAKTTHGKGKHKRK